MAIIDPHAFTILLLQFGFPGSFLIDYAQITSKRENVLI